MQSDEDGRVRVFELEYQEMAKSTTAEDEVEASEEKSGDEPLQDQNSMQSDEDGRVRAFERESQEREFNAGLTYALFSRVRRLDHISLDPFPDPKRFFNSEDNIRDRQSHEKKLEGMFRQVITDELGRSKAAYWRASAEGEVDWEEVD